jgi:hypothetical protein
MPKPANPATRSASTESVGDGPNADSWAEAYYSESDEEDSRSEEANTTARAELTQQVAVENCKTRSRMVALQRKMAKKRQKVCFQGLNSFHSLVHSTIEVIMFGSEAEVPYEADSSFSDHGKA